jgi:hypothetical protein
VWQVDVTGLNLRRLGRHSIDFAAFRFDADRTRHSLRHGGSEILQKVHARTRILDQDRDRATLPMTKSATLAIDLPMKALVWQDDQGKVWLTYNTSEYNAKYVLPRHGLTAPDDASKALETFLTRVTDLSTQ